MQNESGKIFFGIGIDNSELEKDIQKSKKLLGSVSEIKPFDEKNARSYQNALDALNGTIEQNNDTLNRVKGELNEIISAKKVAGKATAEMNQREIELRKSVSDLTALIKIQQREVVSETGSIDQLKAKIELLNRAYKSMSDTQRSGTMGEIILSEAEKTKAALKTVEGAMSNSAKKSNEYDGAMTKAFKGTWSFAKTLAYLIPGLGIAGLFDLAIEGLKAIWEEIKKNNGALDTFKQKVDITAQALKDSGYIDAKAKVAELRQELKLATAGKISAKKAVDDYNESLGKATGGVSSLGEMEQRLGKQAEAYLQMLQLKTKATIAYRKAAEQGVEADIEMSDYGNFGAAFMRILKTPSQWFKNLLPKINNPFQVQIDYADSKRKAEKNLNLIGDNYQKEAADIAQKFKLNFFNDTETKNGNSIAKRVYEDTKDVKDLLDEIANSKEKYQIQFGEKLESEQLKINNYFDSLAKKVDEFNKDPKRKVKLSAEQINAAKQSIEGGRSYALGLSIDRESGEALLIQLEEQKKLYKDYEDFKTKYGENAANELYGNLTSKYKSYLEKVQHEYNKLESKGAKGLNTSEAVTFSKLTEILAKAKSDVEQLRIENIKSQIEKEENSYQQIIKKAKDYYLQVSNLEKEHSNALAALNRKNLSYNYYDEQFKAIEGFYRNAKKKLDVESSDFYIALNTKFEDATKEQLKSALDIINNAIKTGKFKNKIGDILDVPAEILMRLNQYRDQLQGIISYDGRLQETSKQLGDIGKAFQNIGSSLNQIDGGGLGDIVSTVGEMVSTVSNVMANFKQAMNEMKNAFSGGSKQKFDFSSIFSIIISAISFIIRLFGNIKRYKEQLTQMQTEIAQKNAEIELGEYVINEELRKQNEIKAQSLEITLKQLEARKKELELSKAESKSESERLLQLIQSEKYVSDRDIKKRSWISQLFGGKAKEVVSYGSLAGMDFEQINRLFVEGRLEGRALALFQQLQKLKEEGLNIEQQLIDLQKEANEVLTATTANTITDSIISGFREGNKALEDFAGNFEDLMREAMLNSLKYQYLEEPIQDFYKKFSEATASDNVLTSQEITALKNYYNQIISDAKFQFDSLKDISGKDVWQSINEQSRQASSKGFASMSQDSANELNGRFAVIQTHTFNMNESLKLLSPLTSYANEIKSNIALMQIRSAQALTHLSNIDTNTARLQEMEGDLRKVKTGIDDINLKGIKIKT